MPDLWLVCRGMLDTKFMCHDETNVQKNEGKIEKKKPETNRN